MKDLPIGKEGSLLVTEDHKTIVTEIMKPLEAMQSLSVALYQKRGPENIKGKLDNVVGELNEYRLLIDTALDKYTNYEAVKTPLDTAIDDCKGDAE